MNTKTYNKDSINQIKRGIEVARTTNLNPSSIMKLWEKVEKGYQKKGILYGLEDLVNEKYSIIDAPKTPIFGYFQKKVFKNDIKVGLNAKIAFLDASKKHKVSYVVDETVNNTVNFYFYL